MMMCLVACEESQKTTIQLRYLGHTAFSCDLQDCSGGHPEWHIKGDCLPIINGFCSFTTSDGVCHCIGGKWDLIIAHPPCTYLSFAGNKYLNVEKYGDKALKRYEDREKAFQFAMSIWGADCEHLAMENPTGYINSKFRKADQVIEPYEFGDFDRKRTCLWVRGLPLLVPDYVVPAPEPYEVTPGGYKKYFVDMQHDKHRGKSRSVTFDGIARAMAYQYTCNFFMTGL